MKKTILYMPIIAIAMLAMSCSNSECEEIPQSGEVTVTFNVANYEQIDMDDDVTRSTAITNLYWLTLGIYDAETLQLVTDTVTQYYTESGFGTFSVTLPYGEYKVLVLGYTSTRQPDMTDPTAIVFTDNYVPHLFSNLSDLTVDAETMETQSILLSRVVAAFHVEWSDTPPANISGIYIVAEGGSYELNATTGYANEVKTRVYDMTNFTTTDTGLIVYFFLTEEGGTMDFTMTAYDTDGAQIVTHHFTDVPMKINQRTLYRGNFFSPETSEGSFTIGLAQDFDWENEVDDTFNFSD